MGDITPVDYFSTCRLAGKGFVLLGAGGGGMGTETARALAGAGARLLCVDQSAAEAETLAHALSGEGIAADIRSRPEMERVFQRADALFGSEFYGVVDVVGVARAQPLETFDDETIDWQFGIVFRHAVLAMQLALPLLIKNGGGTMTFVGSRVGSRTAANQAMYGAAKAALHHLVRVAALEFAPHQIRVNAVEPGWVKTPRLLKSLSAETWEQIEATNPTKRAAVPTDIAKSILFLASELSSYVTGNIIVLDGAAADNVRPPGFEVRLAGQPLT